MFTSSGVGKRVTHEIIVMDLTPRCPKCRTQITLAIGPTSPVFTCDCSNPHNLYRWGQGRGPTSAGHNLANPDEVKPVEVKEKRFSRYEQELREILRRGARA